jgi:hypothetical protein
MSLFFSFFLSASPTVYIPTYIHHKTVFFLLLLRPTFEICLHRYKVVLTSLLFSPVLYDLKGLYRKSSYKAIPRRDLIENDCTCFKGTVQRDGSGLK